MADYKVDRRDIRFVLYELLDVEKICELEAFSDFNKELFDMVIDEGAKLAEEVLAPLNKVMDEKGAQFDKGKVSLPEEIYPAWKALVDGGWMGVSHSPEYGGQGLPNVVAMAASEGFIGGNCAFSLTPMLTRGAAHVIESYGTEEMKSTYLEKMYTGEWAGTMCLTEAQAGSAVGDTRTSAKKEGDHYLLEGTKIFITSGDHDLTPNIVHLVLARTEGAPSGIKGISLFVVPKFLVNDDGSIGEFNDVACGGIEHKMGIKGSPTCTMNFGENGTCQGWLIGEECKGIVYMFQMMNEARLEVGHQGQSLGAAAYHEALEYAKERIQGVELKEMRNPDAARVPIIRHADVKRMLMLMKSYVEGMRAMFLSIGYYLDLSHNHPDEELKNKYKGFIELLTPICKAYGSDAGFKVADLGIMIHGGYGYCQEYPAEQYLRDVKIAAIYEGANGIQAMDLVGRKLGLKGGMVLLSFLTEINNWLDANRDHEELADYIKVMEDAKNTLTETTMNLQGAGMQGDFEYVMLHASNYLEIFGHVCMAWYLLQSAVVAHEKWTALCRDKGADSDEAKQALILDNLEAQFYDSKVKTAKFFVCETMPIVHARAKSVTLKDRSALDVVL